MISRPDHPLILKGGRAREREGKEGGKRRERPGGKTSFYLHPGGSQFFKKGG